jgi:hypothetical protein
VEKAEGEGSINNDNSKFDGHGDDSNEEDENEESKGSHGSGFARLTKEQKVEEMKRKANGEFWGGGLLKLMRWKGKIWQMRNLIYLRLGRRDVKRSTI